MKILLYVDDSQYWHDAARLIGQFARMEHAHVTVVATAWLSMHRTRALREARRLLDLPEAQVSSVERAGLVEYVVPDLARELDVDLVVIGRLGSLDKLTSGLVALVLLKRTQHSLLIVRPHLKTVHRVLVCTEGPRHGEENFDLAARAARAFEAELTVLHVVSQMGVTESGRASLDQDLRDFMGSGRPEARHLVALRERMKDENTPGAVKVRRGLVVDEVLAEAHEGGHDLLVIGAHDEGGSQGYLYEDFTSLIVRSSPVSTLVLKDKSRARPPPAEGGKSKDG